jgi:imidazolonepropionase-like amidohydrolase
MKTKSSTLEPTPMMPLTTRRSPSRSAAAWLCGVLVAASVMVGTPPALAQDLTLKPGPQSQPVLVVNARVHTMRLAAASESLADVGTGLIENADVLFENGKIVRVVARDVGMPIDKTGLPANAVVVDAGGAAMYPGLIAAWTQLGMTEIQAVAASNDLAETGSITPEVRATIAINPDSTLLPVTRKTGILLAAVAPGGGLLSGQAGVIRMDGWTIDEIAVERSIGQVVRWPSMRTFTAWWMERSEEQQRVDISANVARIEGAFDAAEAYLLAKLGDETSLTDLRWEAMRSVLPTPAAGSDGTATAPSRGDKPCFFVASDAAQIVAAINFANERGLKAVIVGGREATQVAPLLKQHDVPVILLGVHNMPTRDDSAFDEPFVLARDLHQAGVRFAFSHADDTAHERNLPFAVGTAVAHGLPEAAALRALTRDAAEILGVGDRYGSLEPGKSATFFLVRGGSPLEVVSEVTTAFIDGRAVPLTSKQTELAKKYLERYRQQQPAAGE